MDERGLISYDGKMIVTDKIERMSATVRAEVYIIVDKKFKRTILDELASIGIDQAFIYPELEYTARKIAKTLAERNARY